MILPTRHLRFLLLSIAFPSLAFAGGFEDDVYPYLKENKLFCKQLQGFHLLDSDRPGDKVQTGFGSEIWHSKTFFYPATTSLPPDSHGADWSHWVTIKLEAGPDKKWFVRELAFSTGPLPHGNIACFRADRLVQVLEDTTLVIRIMVDPEPRQITPETIGRLISEGNKLEVESDTSFKSTSELSPVE